MQADKLENLGAVLHPLLDPDFIDYKITHNEATLWVYPASIVRTLTLLSTHKMCDFKQLVDITAVDYPTRAQRFEIVYHLLSHSCNQRLRIKILVSEGAVVPTITQVFANANWYEREVWDLFGIVFCDHPDLRRILTDYNFSGHPLRKDFPLTGYTQVRYCEKEKRVLYEPVSLQQDYRQFDFISPWEGPDATRLLNSSAPPSQDLLAPKTS